MHSLQDADLLEEVLVGRMDVLPSPRCPAVPGAERSLLKLLLDSAQENQDPSFVASPDSLAHRPAAAARVQVVSAAEDLCCHYAQNRGLTDRGREHSSGQGPLCMCALPAGEEEEVILLVSQTVPASTPCHLSKETALSD